MDDDNLSGLAFDLYERYHLVQRIAPLFAPAGGSSQRVLDVGGNTPLLWNGFRSMISAVLPDDTFAVTTDLDRGNGIERYVQSSVLSLPFPDNSFDLVTSCDMLEHLPEETRVAALGELLRVTRDGLYLTFPGDSPSNRIAEKMLVDFLDVYAGGSIPQLREHDQYGLPDRERVRAFFETANVPAVGFGHGNTDVWLLLMLTFHWLRVTGGEAFVKELNRRFNLQYCAFDWAEPTYRACFLISKQRSQGDLQQFADNLRKPAGAAPGTQGVLSLCQLILQITYQGRVLLDKDRHIRHLEATLEHFRRESQFRPETLTGLEQRVDLLRNELQNVANASAQWTAATEQILSRLTHSPQISERLERQLSRADRQVSEVRERLDAQAKDVHQILNSRIWRTLCSAGAFVLNTKSLLIRLRNKVRLQQHADIELVCDEPTATDGTPARGVIAVRGWALAPSGIDRVLVQLDDAAAQEAEYGLPRPDVARCRPENSRAAFSGFHLKLDPALLTEGSHRIGIQAVSRTGAVKRIETQVLIDRAFASEYDRWIADCEHREDTPVGQAGSTLPFRPLISIIMPVYRTPAEILRRAIESVRNQTYAKWELCVADDFSESPDVDAVLTRYSNDPRVKVVRRTAQGGISAASNSALELAAGEFIALLDHDDELAPDALYHVADAVNREPNAGLLYTDEDKIDLDGRRYEPFFKPAWSPDLLLSENYICHLLVLRRTALERAGGFRPEFDGSQDYDLILRVSRLTDQIVHIPRVLYHWRASPTSTAGSPAQKPQSSVSARNAIEDHLRCSGLDARVEPGIYPGRWRIRYSIPEDSDISIVIPSGGKLDVLRTNLDRLAEVTDYPKYQIVVVDNSKGDDIAHFVRRWKKNGRQARYQDCRNQPFNWSALNNQAARQCDSRLLLFLNDDTEVIAPGWLTGMAELALQPKVGAVGAKLLYPDGRIQHAGVVMGLFENCGHAFKGLPGRSQHYFDLPDVIRNVSAVTGACLMVRRDVFSEVGGFDEGRFAVAFNDIDFCLRVGTRGYRILYTPHALLYHHEAFSKTAKDLIPESAEVRAMQSAWEAVIESDPYYNPNLTRTAEDYSLALCGSEADMHGRRVAASEERLQLQ